MRRIAKSACPSAVRPRRGTTLVELVVSLAVLGIVLAIAAPALGALERPVRSTSAVPAVDSVRRLAIHAGRSYTLRAREHGNPHDAYVTPLGQVYIDTVQRSDSAAVR